MFGSKDRRSLRADVTDGAVFAVLNMANAYVPGGAYIEGAPAQEENMFRRSDCHFAVDSAEMNSSEFYLPEMTALLNGEKGTVYLDTEQPRICIRGAEDRDVSDLGYPWLPNDEIFPFFELRAAARDYRARFGHGLLGPIVPMGE